MSSDSIEASALAQLQSKQKDLLDDIDKLRDAGLGRYIPLPQLVVVGDQSSGKSSVLEAISRVRFPTESGICTRFATQVALRRAPATAISVSIRPGDSRKDTTERAQLEAFQHNFNDESQLPAMVSQAKEAMGIGRAGRSFSDDILSVEVTGPDKPHLTLVDLPGLIRDADSQTDITLVKRLVESYMRESKSIILAIVAANYDTANQEVLNLIRQMDPVGTRTLGIVTKPDRLEPEQDDERNCVKLIQNERTFLRLGWHVVRNRSDATRKATDQERDDAEMAFLSNRIWTQIDRKHKGAESLRSRLSDVLLHQISSNLSDLIADIKNQLNDSKERLSKLGEPRETAKQQRNHLLNISSKFQNLVQNSNEGRYIEDFSSVVTQSDWPVKRLRAAIERNNRRFAEEMHQRGHRRQVYESLLGSSFGVPSLSPWSTESYEQKFLTRHTLAAELDDDAVRLRDRSLPGFPNSHLVSHLFKDQSKPWHVLAAAHVLACYNAARRTVRLALAHVANEDVCERISRQVIEPWLFERKKAMDNMLSLVAKPLLRNDPMTYNPVYELKTTNQFRAAQRGNLKNNLSNGKPDSIQESEKNFSWNDIQVAQSKETSSTKLATSLDIITKTEAYYEVCLYCVPCFSFSAANIVPDCDECFHRQCLYLRYRALST